MVPTHSLYLCGNSHLRIDKCLLRNGQFTVCTLKRKETLYIFRRFMIQMIRIHDCAYLLIFLRKLIVNLTAMSIV